jgi:hypothetical protein
LPDLFGLLKKVLAIASVILFLAVLDCSLSMTEALSFLYRH